jgi:hypothetical protein
MKIRHPSQMLYLARWCSRVIVIPFSNGLKLLQLLYKNSISFDLMFRRFNSSTQMSLRRSDRVNIITIIIIICVPSASQPYRRILIK